MSSRRKIIGARSQAVIVSVSRLTQGRSKWRGMSCNDSVASEHPRYDRSAFCLSSEIVLESGRACEE